MLGKIIKHEFKATYGTYFLLFLVLMALTVVAKVLYYIPIHNTLWEIVTGLILILYIVVMVFITAAAMILGVVRFYKTMVKDQGYLTHTIPVKESQLILGKLITSSIWILASIGVMLISLFVAFLGTDIMKDLFKAFGEISTVLSQHPSYIGYIVSGIILVLISIVSSLLLFYAAIALGQMFTGHKVAGAVLFYFVIYYIYNFISMAMLFIIPGFIEAMDNMGQSDDAFLKFILVTIFMQIVYCIASFTIVNYRFSKRLNIE